MKFDLQMFAEAVAGKKIIYLYRLLKEQASEDGTRLAFTTENSRTKSKDADSTATKDGSIRTPGTAEVEITATSILTKGDTMIDKLEDALDNDELIELWETNLDEQVEATYALTTDTDVVPGKVYYTKSGDVYTEVANPVKEDIATYYEMTGGKFKGMYFQGYLTELEKSSNAEDMTEMSLTFGINGSGKRGNVTVSAQQQEDAGYAFIDTPKTGA